MTISTRTILTICTANRCRSPMLTSVLRHRIEVKALNGQIAVISAGLLAREGTPVDPVVLDLLESRALPVHERHAHELIFSDIRRADLILVATEQHRLGLFHRSPENLYKVVLLSELIGVHQDLDDPFNQPRSAYLRTLEEIEKTVDSGWSKLLALLAL